MKLAKFFLYVYISLASLSGFAQISFVLTNSLCAEDSVYVIANTNSFPATTFSWSVNPASAVISSVTSQATYITFTNSGIHTISLAGTVGNVTSFATHTILIQPRPQISISSSNATICSGQSATLIATGASSYSWVPTPGFVVAYSGTAYVSPGTTEIYTVSGSNTEGCISHETYTLQFGTFPNLSVLATSTAVCVGYNATLTAFGANNYSWTSSNFSGTQSQASLSAAPGTYSVIGSNGGSCVDSSVISIAMSPSLSLIISANRNVICKDGGDTLVPISLNAQGAITYTWEPYNPNYMTYSVGPSTSISPTISTCYTLSGSTSVCSGKTSYCIEVRNCVGFNETVNLNKTILLYPNPVNDVLNIQTDFPEPLTFELSDVFGNTFMKRELDQNRSQNSSISLLELLPGFYVIKFSRNKEILSIKRILKE